MRVWKRVRGGVCTVDVAVWICRVWTWWFGSEALEKVWICKVVRDPELRKCVVSCREVCAQELYQSRGCP